MKDKLKFSRNLSLTGWLVVCLSVLQIFESLVVMFVNLFTQMPAVIDDTQKTLLSNLEQELSKRGSSLLDVQNQFEVIQLVLLIIMSFFIISLFQNLKGYLNGVHKIFELDLYIVIMIFSNLFLIMTSVLLFLIGNQGIIEDMVETISMILVLVYLFSAWVSILNSTHSKLISSDSKNTYSILVFPTSFSISWECLSHTLSQTSSRSFISCIFSSHSPIGFIGVCFSSNPVNL